MMVSASAAGAEGSSASRRHLGSTSTKRNANAEAQSEILPFVASDSFHMKDKKLEKNKGDSLQNDVIYVINEGQGNVPLGNYDGDTGAHSLSGKKMIYIISDDRDSALHSIAGNAKDFASGDDLASLVRKHES